MKNNDNIINFLLASPRKDGQNLYDWLENYSLLDNINDQQKHYMNVIYDARNARVHPDFIKKTRKKLANFIRQDTKYMKISAPTAFGKTFLLIEFAKEKNKKTVFISPTLSLCNEYYINFAKSGDFKGKIAMDPFSENAQIYILTPEKSITLFNKQKNFDLVVFDEFYETFSGDRFFTFKQALNLSNKVSKKIITIVPSDVKMKFEGDFSKIKFQEFSTNDSVTTRRYEYFIYDSQKKKTYKYINSELHSRKSELGFKIKEIDGEFKIGQALEKNSEIISKLDKNSNTILVLTTKNKMYTLAGKLKEIKLIKEKSPLVKEAIRYLQEVSPNIFLEKLLSRGIGYHNGGMDKYLRLIIERAFARGELKLLFANSTLTKGVNINPNYMFIDSFTRAGEKNSNTDAIDIIEDRNAIGRTGRSSSIGDMIGKVLVFSSSKKGKKIERITDIRTSKDIELIEPKPAPPKKIGSFADLYKKIINEYEMGEYYLSAKNSTEKTFEYINSFIKVRNLENCNNIINNIIKIYKMDISEKSIKPVINNISSNLMNLGYTRWYKQQIANAKGKYVSQKTGYLIYEHTYKQKLESENKFKNKNSLKLEYHKYGEKKYDNDIILRNIINEYQTEAGFYFKQILSMVIEYCKVNKKISEKDFKEYEKELESEEKIGTMNSWPSAAVDYYLSSNKSPETKKIINEVMEIILEKK